MGRQLLFGAMLATLACGRSGVFRDSDAPRTDGGTRVDDAGSPVDAGAAFDGGWQPPMCPPPPVNRGRVWGATPLGSIDFGYVWVGTEPSGSHSCPHLTLVASDSATQNPRALFKVDFYYAPMPVLGDVGGLATLYLEGKMAQFKVTAHVTRADALRPSAASQPWLTDLTFTAPYTVALEAVLTEVPDCPDVTWFCI